MFEWLLHCVLFTTYWLYKLLGLFTWTLTLSRLFRRLNIVIRIKLGLNVDLGHLLAAHYSPALARFFFDLLMDPLANYYDIIDADDYVWPIRPLRTIVLDVWTQDVGRILQLTNHYREWFGDQFIKDYSTAEDEEQVDILLSNLPDELRNQVQYDPILRLNINVNVLDRWLHTD